MDKKYSLEIYAPGSIEDIWITFESDTPFMGFNEGDIINSKMFPSSDPEYGGKILRVVKLEHFIWEATGIVKHKIGVITEAVEDSIKERFVKKSANPDEPISGGYSGGGLVH